MLIAPEHTTWAEAGLLLAGLLAAGFLASWVLTDLLHWSRHAYIAALTLVTAGGLVAVAAATGTPVADLVAHRWPAGLAGAVVAGLVTGLGIRRMEPSPMPPDRHQLPRAAAWEGLLYGHAEGVLLSALPAFVAWQAATSAGWNDAAGWVAALVASTAMIVVHHLGYWDYRNRQRPGRGRLRPPDPLVPGHRQPARARPRARAHARLRGDRGRPSPAPRPAGGRRGRRARRLSRGRAGRSPSEPNAAAEVTFGPTAHLRGHASLAV